MIVVIAESCKNLNYKIGKKTATYQQCCLADQVGLFEMVQDLFNSMIVAIAESHQSLDNHMDNVWGDSAMKATIDCNIH